MTFNVLTVDNSIDYFITNIKNVYTHINIININEIETVVDIISTINLVILPNDEEDKRIIFLKNELFLYNIPILFISDNSICANTFNNCGVYDFIFKPLDADSIIKKIKYYYNCASIENDLEKEKEIVSAMMEISKNPVFITNGKDILSSNKPFKKLIDNTNLEYENINFFNVSELFNRDGEILNDNSCILDIVNNETKVSIKTKHHKESIYLLKNKFLKTNNLHLVYLNDITHELEYELERIRLLYTDNLTKLPNRIKLIEELKNGTLDICSISLIDINSFKEINDFFGNKIGDEIIFGIGSIIKNYIGQYKHLSLYKFPADIYCVVNFEDNRDSFVNIIKNILEIIDKKVFSIDSQEINTRVTAGISCSTKNNKLITADLALQAAKRDHKDYLVFYDELDNIKEYKNNMYWTNKIKNALNEDKIIVYFQPLINNKTLKPDKYECLVRMRDEDKVVSPFFFLDISKKSNQYHKITRVVIEKSCKTFSTLPYEFSVNISYEDIEDSTFLDFVKDMCLKYEVNNKMVFEILENENIKDYNVLIKFIDEVKKIGCKIAIDDFGSGYSNFEHILKMNVDYLKIDASLIKNVAKDENSYKITKTIIDFAKSLNLKTIAEFVESKEIFDIVNNLGANYSQGYYFSEPLEMPTYTLIDGNKNE